MAMAKASKLRFSKELRDRLFSTIKDTKLKKSVTNSLYNRKNQAFTADLAIRVSEASRSNFEHEKVRIPDVFPRWRYSQDEEELLERIKHCDDIADAKRIVFNYLSDCYPQLLKDKDLFSLRKFSR